MILATASDQGEVIVNNLNQPVSAWDGPIGTDANANDALLAQEITLPAANYASYLINTVTLRLRPNGASASVTVSIWDVDPNNNPGHKISVVGSQIVPTAENIDFTPATNIVLAPGMYYVVVAPTTPAEAKNKAPCATRLSVAHYGVPFGERRAHIQRKLSLYLTSVISVVFC